mmetsp:Transcript_5462/g.7702  ORF Transcript_5462/g.7702 Transcript_5462/m.7702 type:complete len:224 (+) Transcript_5462:1-672(+)
MPGRPDSPPEAPPHEAAALQPVPPPYMQPKIEPNLLQCHAMSTVKLRLLSSWGGKQVSLRAVRLRLQGAAGWLDLLPLCRTRILSGLLPLAASSEACRQLPALTDCQQVAVAARPSKAVSPDHLRRVTSQKDGSVWRASFHSATFLELLFELPPAAALISACRAAGYGEAAADPGCLADFSCGSGTRSTGWRPPPQAPRMWTCTRMAAAFGRASCSREAERVL